MSCVKISNASIDEGRLAAPSIEQSVEFQSAFPQWGLPRRGRRGRRGQQERQERRGQGLRQGWRGQGMLLELWQPGVRVRRRSRALAIGDASMGGVQKPVRAQSLRRPRRLRRTCVDGCCLQSGGGGLAESLRLERCNGAFRDGAWRGRTGQTSGAQSGRRSGQTWSGRQSGAKPGR